MTGIHHAPQASSGEAEVGFGAGHRPVPLVMPKVGHTRDALDELFHQHN